LDRGLTAQEVLEQARLQDQQQLADVAEDLGPLNFKVAGIGKRMKDVVKKVKIAAAVRRRKPLFTQKDKV